MWYKCCYKGGKGLFYLVTTNQILVSFKCRYIHSPKPLTVSDPVHMFFRFSLLNHFNSLSKPSRASEYKTMVLQAIFYITSLYACLCKLLWLNRSLCVFAAFGYGPNQGSGLKLAVAADWYVGCRGSGVLRSWTQAAVAVLWAAVVICGRTFWRAARGQKSQVLL